LAQRIPAHIHIDQVPEGMVLSAGMTATVQIAPWRKTGGVAHQRVPQRASIATADLVTALCLGHGAPTILPTPRGRGRHLPPACHNAVPHYITQLQNNQFTD
jgi:hypothetical protein